MTADALDVAQVIGRAVCRSCGQAVTIPEGNRSRARPACPVCATRRTARCPDCDRALAEVHGHHVRPAGRVFLARLLAADGRPFVGRRYRNASASAASGLARPGPAEEFDAAGPDLLLRDRGIEVECDRRGCRGVAMIDPTARVDGGITLPLD
jgi:hypothetical protein